LFPKKEKGTAQAKLCSRQKERNKNQGSACRVPCVGREGVGSWKGRPGLGQGRAKEAETGASAQHPALHEAGELALGGKKEARGADPNWAVAQRVIPWPATRNRSRKDR
jgi:hypothetical protein